MEQDSSAEASPAPVRPIFISDASVEADELRTRLESAGYLTVEVPLGLLVRRANAQPPGLVVLEGEVPSVSGVIAQLSPSATLPFPLVVLGGDSKTVPPGAAHLSRPIDLAATLELVTALAGPAPDPGARRRARSEQAEGYADRVHRPSALPPPTEVTPFADTVDHGVEHTEFSEGLVELLRRAEERVPRHVHGASSGARRGNAADRLVGEHLLLPLEGSLDTFDDVVEPSTGRRTAFNEEPQIPRARPSTKPPPADEENTSDNLAGSDRAPSMGATALPTVRENSIPRAAEPSQGRRRWELPVDAAHRSLHPPHFSAVCRQVAERFTGCVVVESSAGLQRIVLREGDFSGVASTVPDESLQRFLVAMGRLDASAASELERKLPTYGRHAGAGLVAHGVISSDELWTTLREHSEWLLRRALSEREGRLSTESAIPERLAGEPAVFGGATGAEVLVTLAQEAIPDEEVAAWSRHLDGALTVGSRGPLLAECALPDPSLRYLEASLDTPLRSVINHGPTRDFPRVLYALFQLEVVGMSSSDTRKSDKSSSDKSNSQVHQEATAPDKMPETLRPARLPQNPSSSLSPRERILSHKALVEEGNYFAILDVHPAAAEDEVSAAYQRLKKLFEPSQVLTPETADLKDDVLDILQVLTEAYEILQHPERRKRYRAAITE